MANKYLKYAGRSLQVRLEEMQQEGHPIKDLTDEIEIARSLLIDALALHERCAALPPGDKRVHAMIEAGRIVQDQLREISDLVVKMAKVEQDMAAIPVDYIPRMINQMVRCIAKPIEEALLPLNVDPGPVIAACGVAIRNIKIVTTEDVEADENVQYAPHPAQLAEDMDETVPCIPLSLAAPASPRDGEEHSTKHVAGG